MNWKTLIDDMRKHVTLQQIATECGLASKGHVHDIGAGKQKTVSYDAGVKLVAMHKRLSRRKPK